MNRPIVLDHAGQPRPAYTGPAVVPVVTQRCWICHGFGYVETGLEGYGNVGAGHRCANCGGSGRLMSEVAA